MTWQELEAEIDTLRDKKFALLTELMQLRAQCEHAKLPKHGLGEQYVDKCPDCGFVAYCYRFRGSSCAIC